MHINDILTWNQLPDVHRRFAALTDQRGPDACWPWLGDIEPAGYGLFSVRYAYRAHRVAWVLANGPIPPSGTKRSLVVRHRCDNRACVNPAHLLLGTDADNAADMVARKRQMHGAKHWSTARTGLTEAIAAAIRQDTRRVKIIAAEHGVSRATVYGIQRGHTWKHLPVPLLSAPRQRMEPGAPKPPKPPKPPKLRKAGYVKTGQPRGPKPTEVADEVIIAIRASTETLAALSRRYGLGMNIVWRVTKGLVGKHIPLRAEQPKRHRGRPRK